MISPRNREYRSKPGKKVCFWNQRWREEILFIGRLSRKERYSIVSEQKDRFMKKRTMEKLRGKGKRRRLFS